MTWTINLPLRVPISKNKQFSLNLNQYRNTHFQSLNKAKDNYQKIAAPLIRHLPFMERCSLEYVLYPATRQLCDVSNVCSIVDKFFSDVLVAQRKIPDDNYLVIASVDYRFGRIDKHNPRVEVIIRSVAHPDMVEPEAITEDLNLQPLKKEELTAMQITTKTVVTLTKTDVAKALAPFLAELMATGATLQIENFDKDLEVTILSTSAPATVEMGSKPGPKPSIGKAPPAAQEKSETTAVSEAAPVTQVEEKPVQAPPTPPQKSLFAGLRKPTS